MEPRDKYTVFSKWDRGYRKGIHKMPKFTRVRVVLFSVGQGAEGGCFIGYSTREPEGFLDCLYMLLLSYIFIYTPNSFRTYTIMNLPPRLLQTGIRDPAVQMRAYKSAWCLKTTKKRKQ